MENVKKDIDGIESINIELEHTWKNELRKLKRKNVDDTMISKPNATIAPGMFKLDIEPFSHRFKNNRDAHEELLVHVSQTCPNSPKPSEKLVAVTPMNKNKRVRFVKPVTSSSNIPKQTDSLKTKDSNKPLLTFTGVTPTTSASGSKPSGNIKNNRITRPPSSNQKNKVEGHSKKVKSSLIKMNSVYEPASNALVRHSVRNVKFESICTICNKCLFDANHDMCIIDHANVRSKSTSKRNKMRKVWKPMGKMFSEIGYSWKPIGKTFTIVRNRFPLTRITSTKVVPTKETSTKSVAAPTQGILVYSRRPKSTRSVGSSSKYLDSGCSKHITGNRSQRINFVSKFLGTIRFGNDHIAKIMGYGDYQMGNVTISQVYYMERPQRPSHGCGRLSHLNFDYINSLAKHGLVRGLPKLKYQKDHLCSACALGKSKKHSHKPKAEDSIQEKLYLLHMDLCGPMRVQSINLAHTPQQNGIVERRNCTLVEADRTMLIFSEAPLFLWEEALAIACYTQNRSLIQKRHNKTPYELLHDRKPDLSYLHVFGALCYPTNDGEDLGKLKLKVDIGIFVGYAPTKKAF
ncbi:integrase, catalytic region, zinc finger, CCHC-type containing protein [Tanacetum coccineum]|uniref:Integrase, catalytic region, zinc finger, CCHC-type containing protein n=1 Tax=Tanacetum coccineum TaxID=301880 RepID=A0ABQ4WGY6_9ASTR